MSEQEEIYQAIKNNENGRTYTEEEMRKELDLEYKKVLKKDIVIPAGTVFTEAPYKTVRVSKHVEAIIGLTDDVAVSFTIPADEDLKDYFD